jgi:hypothetical protein
MTMRLWVAFLGRKFGNLMKMNMFVVLSGYCAMDEFLRISFLHQMNHEPYFNKCSLHIETRLHALCDCPLARVVWMHLVPASLRSWFFNMDLQQRIEEDGRTLGGILFWRNKEIHDISVSSPPDYKWP